MNADGVAPTLRPRRIASPRSGVRGEDETFAHRGGHRVRLIFFSAAAYRKIRMLGLCGNSGF